MAGRQCKGASRVTHVHLPLTPAWLVWPLPYAAFLLLLLLLPVLWLYWRRRGQPALRFSVTAVARRVQHRSGSAALGLLPLLRLAALACLLVALARPQRANMFERTYTEGVAIQMVLDTSSSMWASDLSPPDRALTRLDVAKAAFRQFVAGEAEGLGGVGVSPANAGRPHDLIGLIRFALYPDSICPLTLDHDALLEVLAETDLVERRSEDGTAIGDALALAVERLRQVSGTADDATAAADGDSRYRITSRVIILLTDGEDRDSRISVDQAGELAALHDIRIYAVLVGTEPTAATPLARAAAHTDGGFYRAPTAAALQQVYTEIDALERSRIEAHRYFRYGELARPWLLSGFVALALQTLLAATWLRRIP